MHRLGYTRGPQDQPLLAMTIARRSMPQSRVSPAAKSCWQSWTRPLHSRLLRGGRFAATRPDQHPVKEELL